MLVFTLKKHWFEKIKSGEKSVEYREVKPYWTKRLNPKSGLNSIFLKLLEAKGARLEYRIAKILNMQILEFQPE